MGIIQRGEIALMNKGQSKRSNEKIRGNKTFISLLNSCIKSLWSEMYVPHLLPGAGEMGQQGKHCFFPGGNVR